MPRSLLDIDRWSFDLGFEGSVDQRRVRQDVRDQFRREYNQKNRAYRLEETLGFQGNGNIFGPDVMLFDLGLNAGLSQEGFNEHRPGPDISEHPSGSLFNYDGTLTLFPRGKVTATAYAKREDSRVPRAFQPSLDRTLERYGVDMLLNDRVLPMKLSYEHLYDELTSRTRSLEDDERRGHDRLRYEATWQQSERHALRFEYEYEDRTEQYSGLDTRFDTTRHYFNATDTLRFGSEGQHSLETLARAQEESGDLARDLGEFSTQLRLQHTKRLQTTTKFQYLRETFQELRTTNWRGETGVTWQPTDKWTFTGQIFGYREHADENADISEWGALAGAAYATKNNLGDFRANLNYNFTHLSSDDAARRGVVIGESVTLRDPQMSLLAQSDIDRATIIVTDPSRLRTYVLGRDYALIPIGRYTGIRRIASGRINDRDTVYVAYTYRVYRNYRVERNRIDGRIQQSFAQHWTAYYAASVQDEDIDNDTFLRFQGRNVNRHRVGLTYAPNRWSATGEYEYHDDAIDPYSAMHVSGDVVIYQDPRTQLDGTTRLSRFWYDGSGDLDPRNSTLFDIGLDGRYLLQRDLEAKGAARYRYEADTLRGDTRGVDLSAALDWKIGLFTLSFEAEYDLLYLPGSRDDGFSLWLKLRREIPVIGGRP